MPKRVLTIDDSKTIRDMVALALRRAGYEVLQAENGIKALILLDDSPVDLIITDLNMPRMDGAEVVRELRTKARHRATPILVLTIEGEDDKKQECRDAGATGWIVKPFAPSHLVSVVQKYCGA